MQSWSTDVVFRVVSPSIYRYLENLERSVAFRCAMKIEKDSQKTKVVLCLKSFKTRRKVSQRRSEGLVLFLRRAWEQEATNTDRSHAPAWERQTDSQKTKMSVVADVSWEPGSTVEICHKVTKAQGEISFHNCSAPFCVLVPSAASRHPALYDSMIVAGVA
jgi:hypothetical protein